MQNGQLAMIVNPSIINEQWSMGNDRKPINDQWAMVNGQ
jgi:hypothetical protein